MAFFYTRAGIKMTCFKTPRNRYPEPGKQILKSTFSLTSSTLYLFHMSDLLVCRFSAKRNPKMIVFELRFYNITQKLQ